MRNLDNAPTIRILSDAPVLDADDTLAIKRSLSDLISMYVERESLDRPWASYKAQGGLCYKELVLKYSESIIDVLIDLEMVRKGLC